MANDPVISARNLSKSYRIYDHPLGRLRQMLSFGSGKHYREFEALKDVSFDIHKGETVGIIGRNGSGKSTLLQLICGIRKPTSGEVVVNGRVSALLELGAGFHPEFTGRENVFMQGAIMGFTPAEMEARFEDIADFADIGEFIYQPVKTYSSGMFVRLAFAVSTHVTPDILVVDEALAVGDVVFQHKSRKKIQELVDGGAILLMVSHDRNEVSSCCKRCILMDKGFSRMEGLPSDVFDYYYALAAAKNDDPITRQQIDEKHVQIISGTGEARMESIRLLDTENQECRLIEVGSRNSLEFVVRTYQKIPNLVLGFSIRDHHGQLVFGTNTIGYAINRTDLVSGSRLVYTFAFDANLGTGSYSISTTIVSTGDRYTNNYESKELAYFFEVENVTKPLFGGSSWLRPTFTVRNSTVEPSRNEK